MRAAVVLRHLLDLSVAEAADALNCSEGTVKSQTARGLDQLRAALTPDIVHPTGAQIVDGVFHSFVLCPRICSHVNQVARLVANQVFHFRRRRLCVTVGGECGVPEQCEGRQRQTAGQQASQRHGRFLLGNPFDQPHRPATAVRSVASLPETSTIRASPPLPRWLRPWAGDAGEGFLATDHLAA